MERSDGHELLVHADHVVVADGAFRRLVATLAASGS
jgi:hypothetical protein